ncbi:MAG: hypothetical protein IKC56_00295 [Clostridia bacterium]|nr:hypothetical protein [Clostridia bacterium]
MKKIFSSENFSYAKLKDALRNVKSGDEIFLSAGEYHIYEKETEQVFYYQSNCDAGVKNIAFYLKNKKNVKITGDNAHLVFHGRVSPFIFDGCKNITLSGFTLDYAKAFYMQGEVVASTDEYVELKVKEGTSLAMQNGFLTQKVEEITQTYHDFPSMWQAFDKELKRVLFGSQCRIVRFTDGEETQRDLFRAELLDSGNVRFYGKEMAEFTVGCIVVLNGESRQANTLFAFNCKNLTVQDVTAYYTPSMGVNCQTCHNVTLRRFHILLGEERHGIVTAGADATHFINCTGKVHLKECIFENMLDDGANIHGIFTKVTSVEKNKVKVILSHNQQYGANVYFKGDTLSVYQGGGLVPRGKAKVLSSELTKENEITLTLKGTLPKEGDLIENFTRQAKFTFDDCSVTNNRPRGVLVATRKKAVVKNSWFSNSSSCVEVSAESKYWYESGGVKNLLIKNNVFNDFCHQYGGAAVGIVPVYDFNEKQPEYYCQNIRIKNNVIITDSKWIVYALRSKNITVKNNAYIHKDTGKSLYGEDVCFYQENCKDMKVTIPVE